MCRWSALHGHDGCFSQGSVAQLRACQPCTAVAQVPQAVLKTFSARRSKSKPTFLSSSHELHVQMLLKCADGLHCTAMMDVSARAAWPS